MIYHKYLPQENYQQIYTNSDELVKRAEALTKAKLRTDDDKLQKKFDDYSTQLVHSCEKLREQLKSNNYEMVKFGVEDVHRLYQKIESLFIKK
jgi:glycine/serine hydroxymethyltransferase